MSYNEEVRQELLEYGPIYEDATHKYFGETNQIGSQLNEPVFRVSRLTKATGRHVYADGDTEFDNVYTDLNTVAALTYTEDA